MYNNPVYVDNKASLNKPGKVLIFLEVKFPRQSLKNIAGMWRRVVWYEFVDVSEKPNDSVVSVEELLFICLRSLLFDYEDGGNMFREI
jgi:hypothetical protein